MTFHPFRVVVVDDDPDIRDLVAINFAAEGFEVLTAGDGNEAERIIRAELPDVVILDIMMPDRDGLEVLRSLRSDPVTRDINVVLLSARSTDHEIFNGLRAGTDYYMTKPFDPFELIRYVSYLLNEEQRVTARP